MATNEQIRLAEFIGGASPKDLATYLEVAPKLQRELLRFNADSDIDLMIKNLRSRDSKLAEAAREYLDDYVERTKGRVHTSHIPHSVRLKSAADEFLSNISDAGESLRHMGKAIYNKNYDKAIVTGVAALTETLAATLSGAFKLKIRERQLAIALIAETGIAASLAIMMSGTAQAAVSPNDISSAMNDFNGTSYTEPHVPLQITVTGGSLSGDFGQAIALDNSPYQLSPYLIQKVEKDPQSAQYLNWIVEAAIENKVDPIILANQLYRESVHFQDKYVLGPEASSAGAMGIAQFIEETGKHYGLQTPEDFFNPQKSIKAAAEHMRDLLDRFDNDYILALAAYNGGPGAVINVQREIGRSDITGQEWLAHMRANKDPNAGVGTWDGETLPYVGDITGQSWDATYKNWASRLQGTNGTEFILGFMRSGNASAALNAIEHATNVAPVPMPITMRPS